MTAVLLPGNRGYNQPMPRASLLPFLAAGVFLLSIFLPPAVAQQSAAPANGRTVWLGPEGKPLPFATDQEFLEFLRTAKMKSMKSISSGITAPKKVLLEKDGVQAHAHFNYVDEEEPVKVFADGSRMQRFRDSYKFQGAAYELAKILGLDNVPPAVERRLAGYAGSLSVWIEGAMTDEQRRKEKKTPPDMTRWMHQMEIMHVFDSLIFNTDRNFGNVLIDKDWKVWLIDHTRAFRPDDTLKSPENIHGCERGLFQRLKELDESAVRTRLKPYLRGYEIDAILKRRVKLVEYIEDLIRKNGEDTVLFNEP